MWVVAVAAAAADARAVSPRSAIRYPPLQRTKFALLLLLLVVTFWWLVGRVRVLFAGMPRGGGMVDEAGFSMVVHGACGNWGGW